MIREAILEDANALDNLLSLLIQDERKYDDNISPFLFITDYYRNFIGKDNNYFYVYEVNNEIVGYVYAKIKNDPTVKNKCAIIDALFIKEEYRNQKIASQLLDKVIAKIKENDISLIEISVMYENKIAKHLYESKGFNYFKETLILK